MLRILKSFSEMMTVVLVFIVEYVHLRKSIAESLFHRREIGKKSFYETFFLVFMRVKRSKHLYVQQ